MLYRIRQVMTIINVRLFSLATAIDPFDIITGNNQLEDATDPNTVLYLLDLQGLFYLIRKYAYIWGTIVVICLFISMQFINKTEALGERKKDIQHKLFIVFLISSGVTIFSWMKLLFDAFLI